MPLDPNHITTLVETIKTKHNLDKQRDWDSSSTTYLSEIKKELEEVSEELVLNRRPYLEEELGDVFWDYLNLLYSLELEGKVSLAKVFERACNKYQQRVSTLENGGSWAEVKEKQKLALAAELAKTS